MLRDMSQRQMSCLLIFESVLMPVLPTRICFEHHQYFSQPSALDFTVTHFWMHCSVSVIDLMIMGCICLLRPWNKEVGSQEGVDFHAKYQPQEPRHDPEFKNQWGQIFFFSSSVCVCLFSLYTLISCKTHLLLASKCELQLQFFIWLYFLFVNYCSDSKDLQLFKLTVAILLSLLCGHWLLKTNPKVISGWVSISLFLCTFWKIIWEKGDGNGRSEWNCHIWQISCDVVNTEFMCNCSPQQRLSVFLTRSPGSINLFMSVKLFVPRRLRVLFPVCNVCFNVLFQPCYGTFPKPPSSNKSRVVNSANLHFFCSVLQNFQRFASHCK